MKYRGWIATTIITAIITWLLQQVEPLELCCWRLPFYRNPTNARKAAELQSEVMHRREGGWFHNLGTLWLVLKGHELGQYVYGGDDRKDYATQPSTQQDAKVQENINATVLIVHRHAVKPGAVTKWRLDARTMSSLNVCACERFANQNGVFNADPCTGFLMDKNHVITASHCVGNIDHLVLRRFIVGFQADANGTVATDLDESQVYMADDIVYRSNPCDPRDPDIAIVRLKGQLNIAPSQRVPKGTTLAKETPVYIVGYPIGLPAKYAAGARVRDNNPANAHFKANTDGYDGNSGSPVFNLANQVVGVHVRGVLSLSKPCGCWSSTWCPDNGCEGEDITRIDEVPERTQLYDAQGQPAFKVWPTNKCSGRTMYPHGPTEFEKWLKIHWPSAP